MNDGAGSTRQALGPAAEDREALAVGNGQMSGVRRRLVLDALAAGVDERLVHTVVDEAVAALAQAPVQAFVAILVERAVREDLALRRRLVRSEAARREPAGSMEPRGASEES
jgi:hypothetical protein